MSSQSETPSVSNLCRFAPGDILFAESAAADCVYRLRRGTVEISRAVGDERILLGIVHAGEFIGEMAAIEQRTRHSATARATSDCEAEQIPIDAFLAAVAATPETAQALLLRLSARLRAIEEQLATAAGAPAEQLQLYLEGAAREQFGGDPMPLQRLPFVIGRKPAPGEAASHREIGLQLEDQVPYRLSRAHFTILRENGRYIVRDLDSALGTTVNGVTVGHHFAHDWAPLVAGENDVIAGGLDSPYRFRVIVAMG